MKKAYFLICAALLSLAACVKVQPTPDPVLPGVNIFADDAFTDGTAVITARLENAVEENVVVYLELASESEPLTTTNVIIPESITIEKGETEKSETIAFKKKGLEPGVYSAVVRILKAEGTTLGEKTSVTISAEVLPKQDWSPLPEFNKVKTFPTIIITTDGSIPSNRVSGSFPYVTGKVVFNDPDGMYSDVPVVEGTMQIRKRGNTTAGNAKCGYRIKLDENSKIFGMKGDKDWNILAEWSDGTLMRNQTAMQVSRIIGMPWTPKCVSAEVTLNGKKIGMYTLFEHKEVADNKIKMSEDGYFLEIDDKEEDKGSSDRFTTPNYYKVVKFKEPEWPASDQKTFVQNFFKELEAAFAATPETDAYNRYKEKLDLDSFVRNYLVQELTKNVDGNLRLSTPLVLDKEGTDYKLRFAMVWDFDLSLGRGEIRNAFPCEECVSGTGTGIRDSSKENGPTGWFVRYAGGRPYGWENPNGQTAWYQRAWNDPEFISLLKEVWNAAYSDLQTVPGYIDALYDFYGDAIQREWNIWQYQNYDNRRDSPKSQYDKMRKFYVDRLAWLNTAINKL